MGKQLVEVIDRKGQVLDRYAVDLPESASHDFEYEEVALLLAGMSGRIAGADYMHLRARCVR
jgi:hypothetical protein